MILKPFTLLLIFISSIANSGVSEWINITLENGHIKIPVQVEGIEAMAILDSGAQANGISERFKNRHKLTFGTGRKVNVIGVHGKERRNTYKNVSVEMLGAQMKFDDLVSLNFGGRNDALLLGAGFLATYIVQIDYPNEKIRFLTRDAMKLGDVVNIDIRTQKGSGTPIVKVNLNNQKDVWLVLDTGNSGGVLLERRIAKQNNWLDMYPVIESWSSGAISSGYTETFSLPIFTIGPYELENVTISVASEGSKMNISSQSERAFSRIKGTRVQGLLGYDVLKHFILTLDYKKGQAHLGLPEI